MSRYVVTVKLGVESIDSGLFKVAAVVIRDTVTGKVAGTTYSGPEEIIKGLLDALESNPEFKIKYE